MINLKIYNLQNKLIQDLNESELPIYIVYLVLKEIFKEIENGAMQQIAIEQTDKEDRVQEQFIPKEELIAMWENNEKEKNDNE